MTITPDELRQVFPRCSDPELYARLISDAWDEFGLKSRNARAGWLGIVGAETGGALQVKREDMMYSASRGNAVFGPRGRKCAHLAPLGNDGRRLSDDRGKAYASCVYENMYGNGPRDTLDGWNYRGGGMIGITFKDTYRACGKALGVDLVANPDRLGEPELSTRAAVWFVTKLKSQCHRLLQADDEATFLQAALLVGLPADEAARQRRLHFRREALKVVRDGGTPSVAKSKTVAATVTGAATTTAAGQFAEPAAAGLVDMVKGVMPDAMAAAVTPGIVKWVLIALAVSPLLYVAIRYARKVWNGEAVSS